MKTMSDDVITLGDDDEIITLDDEDDDIMVIDNNHPIPAPSQNLPCVPRIIPETIRAVRSLKDPRPISPATISLTAAKGTNGTTTGGIIVQSTQEHRRHYTDQEYEQFQAEDIENQPVLRDVMDPISEDGMQIPEVQNLVQHEVRPNQVHDQCPPNLRRFFEVIHDGRVIQCILCEEGCRVNALLGHIAGDHFRGYRPYKCGQCDYWIGDLRILDQHQDETGHRNGSEQPRICGIVNLNIEFVIELVYEHSLEAHDGGNAAKRQIVRRLKKTTETLRNLRMVQNANSPASEDSDSIADATTNQSMIPLPSPIDVITPQNLDEIHSAAAPSSNITYRSQQSETEEQRQGSVSLPNTTPPPANSSNTTPSTANTSTLKCDFCPVTGYNTSHLLDHYKKMHLANYAPWKCPNMDCAFTTWRMHDLRTHALANHRINIPNKIEQAELTDVQKIQIQRAIESLNSKSIRCDELKQLLQS